jgi:hypothetical protein
VGKAQECEGLWFSLSTLLPISRGSLARRWKLILPAAAVVLLLLVLSPFYFHRAQALTERDSVVLTDFINTTGDSIFDRTLKQATEVGLGQSPFLNVVSEQKVRATLKLMGTLGVFLLLASRNPSAHRSLISFAAWSSFAHACVMAVQASLSWIARRELLGVATFVVIGVALIVLAPGKKTAERESVVPILSS